MRFIHSLWKKVISLSKLDSLGFGFYARSESLEVSKCSLTILKEKEKVSLYKLIQDLIRGRPIAAFKDKINIGPMLNMEYCIGDHNMR